MFTILNIENVSFDDAIDILNKKKNKNDLKKKKIVNFIKKLSKLKKKNKQIKKKNVK